MQSIKWRIKSLHEKYLQAIKNKKPETLIRELKKKWIKAVERSKNESS